MVESSMALPIQPSLAFCVQQMVSRGADPVRLLAGSGLAPASLRDPQTLVSVEQELRVYRGILRASRSGAIGLELGRGVNLNAIGVLGGLLSNAQDLGHAGYLMRRYHLLAGAFFVSELMGELEPGKLTVRYKQTRDLGSLYRLMIDRDILGTRSIMLEIFGPAAAAFFDSVAFGYPKPAGSARYEAEFGCPVSFGHECTYVTYNNAVASLRNTRRGDLAYSIYLRLCREALSRCLPGTWNRKVLNILSSGDDYHKAKDMASKLNCSERSLRRHLKDEGYQYSDPELSPHISG